MVFVALYKNNEFWGKFESLFFGQLVAFLCVCNERNEKQRGGVNLYGSLNKN
jgi:hypothetical protein